MKNVQLANIEQYTRGLFQHDATGHDFYHMKRVAQMAKQIAVEEKANVFICEASGWVHDIGDYKLFTNPKVELTKLATYFKTIHLTDEEINQIYIAIKDVSFSKGEIPVSLEGKIVQDADRLDALGAIGIARTFAFGGAKGQSIFNDANKKGTSIQHFHDKLLKIKDLMNTKTAKQIAQKRHQFIEKYLEQFYSEWAQ